MHTGRGATMNVWVTELSDYEECLQKWQYKWADRLRIAETQKVDERLTMGSSIHKGMEAGLLLGWDEASVAAQVYGEEHELSLEALDKVSLAISMVPLWLKQVANPQCELPLTINTEPPYDKYNNTLSGKPDLWWVDDEGGHVVELKSTADHAKNRLRNLNDFDLQLPRYASMLWKKAREEGDLLSAWPGGMPIEYQYLVLSWRGQVAESGWKILGDAEATTCLAHMSQIVHNMTMFNYHTMHRSKMCTWCAYNPICETLLTGGDANDIIDSKYEFRPRRVESVTQ
jgi:hypothetical protein